MPVAGRRFGFPALSKTALEKKVFLMPVLAQLWGDVYSIPYLLGLLDYGLCQNDKSWTHSTFCEAIQPVKSLTEVTP